VNLAGIAPTWGLTLLANARLLIPELTALLMSGNDFNKYAATHAVAELVIAHPSPPASLTTCERKLYLHLLTCERGRLEQEFLSRENVAEALAGWMGAGGGANGV